MLIKSFFFERTQRIQVQFFRSIFVGAFASIIDILCFAILAELLNVYYLFANLFAFLIGLIINYFLSVTWVFTANSSPKRSKQFFQFFLVAIVGLVINQLILWICVDFFYVNMLFSKILATLIAFIWNFTARRYFIFTPN